jgi:di/tricarboxylate transporter
MVITNIVKPDEAYEAIDWPVIVLLGAMFPVGGVIESTGAAGLIADSILYVSEGFGAVWVLLIVLVATMIISDVINNNATAILMAPIAVSSFRSASRRQCRPVPDGRVAIGASCAFLDADRPSVERAGHGAGRLQIHGLLAHGPAARGRHRRRGDPA